MSELEDNIASLESVFRNHMRYEYPEIPAHTRSLLAAELALLAATHDICKEIFGD